MALLDIVSAGTADYSCTIRIVDSTDGTPELGVVFNTAGIDLWYRRPGAAHTSIVEVTQTEAGAHTDGGFVHISDGDYRLDLPDAAVAAGVDYVDVGGTVTGMIVIGGRIRIPSATRGLSGTALPDAASDAAGGIAISDAGGLDLDAVLSGNTPQTGDSYARLGAPVLTSISADIAAVYNVADSVLTDTAEIGVAGAGLTSITGVNLADDAITAAKYDETTAYPVASSDAGATQIARAGADADTLEALSDQLDALSLVAAPQLMQNTTIATLASQTSFTLTAGAADDNAYRGAIVVVVDSATSTQKCFGAISAYTGATRTVTLREDPGVFTMAIGDTVNVIASDALGTAIGRGAVEIAAGSLPGANPTQEEMGMWLYMALRHKRVTDNLAGEDRIYNNAGTVISEATISGTSSTVTREQYGAVD